MRGGTERELSKGEYSDRPPSSRGVTKVAPPSNVAAGTRESTIPMAGNPPHVDTTQLLLDLQAQLNKALPHLAENVTATRSRIERMSPSEDALQARVQEETDKVLSELSSIGRLKKRLGPWWSVVQWAVGSAAAVFVAGMTWNQFQIDNATVETVQEAVDLRVKPVELRVTAVEKKIDKTSQGVTSLLMEREEAKADEAKEAERRKQERLLEAYRSEYQELLQEYTADKAAGRKAQRPRKDPRHVELEAELDPRPLSARK